MSEMKVLSHEAESLARRLVHSRLDTQRQIHKTRAHRFCVRSRRRSESKEPIDLTVATYALFGMMNWIYNWYDPQGKLKVSDLAEQCDEIVPERVCAEWYVSAVCRYRLKARAFGATDNTDAKTRL